MTKRDSSCAIARMIMKTDGVKMAVGNFSSVSDKWEVQIIADDDRSAVGRGATIEDAFLNAAVGAGLKPEGSSARLTPEVKLSLGQRIKQLFTRRR